MPIQSVGAVGFGKGTQKAADTKAKKADQKASYYKWVSTSKVVKDVFMSAGREERDGELKTKAAVTGAVGGLMELAGTVTGLKVLHKASKAAKDATNAVANAAKGKGDVITNTIKANPKLKVAAAIGEGLFLGGVALGLVSSHIRSKNIQEAKATAEERGFSTKILDEPHNHKTYDEALKANEKEYDKIKHETDKKPASPDDGTLTIESSRFTITIGAESAEEGDNTSAAPKDTSKKDEAKPSNDNPDNE